MRCKIDTIEMKGRMASPYTRVKAKRCIHVFMVLKHQVAFRKIYGSHISNHQF